MSPWEADSVPAPLAPLAHLAHPAPPEEMAKGDRTAEMGPLVQGGLRVLQGLPMPVVGSPMMIMIMLSVIVIILLFLIMILLSLIMMILLSLMDESLLSLSM